MIKNGQVKMELILEDYFKVKNCCLYPVCKFLSTHRLSNNSESTLWFLDFGDHKRRVQVRPKRFLALRTKTVIDFFALSLGERF